MHMQYDKHNKQNSYRNGGPRDRRLTKNLHSVIELYGTQRMREDSHAEPHSVIWAYASMQASKATPIVNWIDTKDKMR